MRRSRLGMSRRLSSVISKICQIYLRSNEPFYYSAVPKPVSVDWQSYPRAVAEHTDIVRESTSRRRYMTKMQKPVKPELEMPTRIDGRHRPRDVQLGN